MHQPSSEPVALDLRRAPQGLRLGRLKRGLQGGFTLLEVMVAIAIAGFTTAALYQTFSMQSKQFVVQDLQMEMNQNLRFASDMVTRSVRMAGYGTGGYVSGLLGPTNPGNSSESSQLPVIIPWDANGANGTDAITVVYADPSLMMDTQNNIIESCDTTSLTFRPALLDNAVKLAQLQAGDLMVCFDYADIRGIETYLWQLSGAPNIGTGAVPINDNSGLTDFDTLCSGTENLTPVMTCSKANVYTFYVDDTADGIGPGSPAHPTLMLDMDMDWPDADDVPLVDNIEDLQLEYCLEDATTGSVDCSVSTNWVPGSSVTAATQAHLIWMVRLSLIGRSSREEPNDLREDVRKAVANRAAGAAGSPDHYLRQYFSTEVAVRNLRYQANL
jgi:prepilin-type N-terminal cleavage/methylation domain-containing protein